MTKISLPEALAIIRAPRDVAIDRALADGATIEDVARAGLLIRKVTTFWLLHADPVSHAKILQVEDEHLEAMRLRMMEIDDNNDLDAAQIAADVLRPR
ncbi:hypothetical protein CQ14_03040 [Bradyrhizobium lablabi]|uniref:Uncharacterized protein n=1 Tax=Bradyrhizobium lablabi TaxID=722472 RepID=A0A0R3N902_9BRAD|nr:hypothetical protein [Bradyrhizobium lablabi]KRR26477.1 hypothetical protein CQ14_03040 [Bradyrhizobium lablabi]